MAVTVANGSYVVELPEYGVRQSVDPETKAGFASEAAALAWQASFIAGLQAAQQQAVQAQQAAEQAALAAQVWLEVTPAAARVQAGGALVVTARMRDGLGATVPLNETYHVPIEDETGRVRKVVRIAMTAGLATATLGFAESGYYRLTEAGINRCLDGQRIRLSAPVEIVCWE